jgi:hypothetical protein
VVAAERDRVKLVAAEANKSVFNWLLLLRAANFSSVLHVGFAVSWWGFWCSPEQVQNHAFYLDSIAI